MAILEKEILVGLSGNNIKYWEDKGYEIPRIKNKEKQLKIIKGSKILVKVGDLPQRSKIKVTKICDICGKNMCQQSYSSITIARDRTDGMDRCKKCGCKYASHLKKHNPPFNRSLYYFALKNNKKYLLNEYSSNNKFTTNKIYYGSNEKCLWQCPNCKEEYEMQISMRTNQKCNCPYCSNHRINKNNCLWSTNPEVAKRLKEKSIGYIITKGSNKEAIFICPDCNYEYRRTISNAVRQGYSCPKCGDGISYPAKFVINFLEQLKQFKQIKKYEKEKKFDCKELGNRAYDFDIDNEYVIIEVNGDQHNDNSHDFSNIGGRTSKEEKENDKLKRRIAIDKLNVKYYLFIDCQKSTKDYIKNSILNSKLAALYDLSKIDWDECAKFAMSSLMIKACKIYNSKKYKYLYEIANELHLCPDQVTNYLKRGDEAKIISYAKHRFIVQISLDNKIIKIWKNITEARKNINNSGHISCVCLGKRKSAGGYKWMYLSDYRKLYPEFTDEDVQKYIVSE